MSENKSKGKPEGKPEWKPQVEFFTSLSQDGRFVICKTVITAIKPIRYFEKVLEGKNSTADSSANSTENGKLEEARD